MLAKCFEFLKPSRGGTISNQSIVECFRVVFRLLRDRCLSKLDVLGLSDYRLIIYEYLPYYSNRNPLTCQLLFSESRRQVELKGLNHLGRCRCRDNDNPQIRFFSQPAALLPVAIWNILDCGISACLILIVGG